MLVCKDSATMHGAIQIGANRLVAVMESDNRLGDGALIKRSAVVGSNPTDSKMSVRNRMI